MKKNKLKNFQTKIGINFKDEKKLIQALIHRSFLNEQKEPQESNERYEFLGDAVLELWATKSLFNSYPHFHEGNMTNLRANTVCTKTLAQTAKQIGLTPMLLLSQGEEQGGGRKNQSILADTFEALICAIFLDQGQASVDKFLNSTLLPKLQKFAKAKTFKDPKSIFQELAQAKEGVTPHYEIIKENGPDHQKEFLVAACIGNQQTATGTGPNKQAAEEKAAQVAISKLYT